MNDQPTALRLADALDAHQFDEPHAAAAELRRLHAKNKMLLDALKAMADEFVKVYSVYYASEPWAHERNKTLQLARAAIAKAEGQA